MMARQDFQGRERAEKKAGGVRETGHVGEVKAMSLCEAHRLIEMVSLRV